MLSVEELLTPRYKVIDRYPSMELEPFHLGQIITLTMSDGDGWIHIPIKHIPGSYMREAFFKEYKNIFQRLEWWQERKPEDMPMYLTCLTPNYKWHKEDIVKVDKWIESFGTTLRFYSPDTDKITHHPFSFLPATLADYNAWKKEGLCTMCNEKPKGEGLHVCKDCYESFDGDRRGFWTRDTYQ